MKKQEPCEDCISRAKAIASLGEEPYVLNDNSYGLAVREQWRDYVKALKDLPSVQSKQKTDVLDKIRAEIEKLQKMCDKDDLNLMVQYSAFSMALAIIDKYKVESEDKE